MAAHVGQVVGLGAAGVWAYFNFVKSRTYHPRLELSVSGEVCWGDSRAYLVPRILLKNIGKSKVGLTKHGTGYRIWTAAGKVEDETGVLSWAGGDVVFDIFANHKWIEPDETIFDELDLFLLPDECVAAKVQARLVAFFGWRSRKSSEWNCSTVVVTTERKKEKGDEPAATAAAATTAATRGTGTIQTLE